MAWTTQIEAVKTETKTLIFEGAGWDDADSSKNTDLKNCRIRTKFVNDKGENIYLEMMNCYRGNIVVDFCYYSDMDINAKGARIDSKHYHPTYAYCKAEALKWINKHCNTSFTDIHTDNSGTYCVHGDNGSKIDMSTFTK